MKQEIKFEVGDVVYSDNENEIGIIFSMWGELMIETRTIEGYFIFNTGFYHNEWSIISKADFK